ncbi:TIGR03571 family LLM class oxidoreductase [Bacillus sp. SB49]|uniref:TIGR03571 family LLM class oxidoreductase n=1 Tax=Bacillaceae TaxID=186817 RepID=UPI0002A4D163|nr:MULTISPECIES: TIGR03571 family LLM class oxidoreductase [Bacillaceae]ELK48881.1 luciferase family protein [Halobacillus sp. BAB-2008]QHT45789.1 TIGR03571 family LLM class oxidoreductase [Bacillus sp. SB49]
MDHYLEYPDILKEDRITFGLTLPIDNYHGRKPDMTKQLERARLAEKLGFHSLWLQDVLLEDPTFEDPATGQIYDSLIYLTYLASQTKTIHLGTAALVLPLRHPLRTAKEIASISNLFPGRLLLGVSSGDRRKDFEGLNVPIMERGEWFRDAHQVIQEALGKEFPDSKSRFGRMDKSNLVPKPKENIPFYMTGYCQQSLDWIAEHSDGWMFYPQRPDKQRETIHQYREKVRLYHGDVFRPFFMPLPLILEKDPDHPVEKIPAGYRTGRKGLVGLIEEYRSIGVNHLMFNLARSERSVEAVLAELGSEVLPLFRL